MSMSTGPLSSAVNSPANAFPIGKKTEVKDKDIKKEDVTQAQNPAIDQKDTLQSNPVKSDSLKTPQKFPDKPSMGIEGKPPKDAQISDGQKPQAEMGVKPKPENGNKPNFPTGKPGTPPSGTKPSPGEKPNFPMGGKGDTGIEGTPPPGAIIYPGKKIID